MRYALRYTLALGLLASVGSEAAVFTVGSDGACTHSNIVAAISAASSNGTGLDEIRLTTDLSNIIAPIASHSVHLRGGFDSCSDSTASGRTIVVGSNAGTGGTITTSGSAAAYQLIVEDLELRDVVGLPGRRGGALRIEGDFSVELRNSVIANNRAGRGGGIYIDGSGGAGLSIDANSSLSNNTAQVSGGGIYCQNDAVIFLRGLILANTAEDGGTDEYESGNGGGVALYDCAMAQRESPGFRGVLANTAQRHGGGYYLRNAGLGLFGDGVSPAKLTDNIAVDTGGGLAVYDDLVTLPLDPSIVTLRNSWVDSNHASRGGGLGLVFGGQVFMERTLRGADCHSTTYCSSLSFNTGPTAGGTCLGAAAYLGASGSLRLRNTIVEENCPGDAGWTFEQRTTSQLFVESSVVANNGGTLPFFIRNEQFTGVLEVAWSTIYGHDPGGSFGFIGIPNHPSAIGTVRVYGSIIGEPVQFLTFVVGGGSPPMTLEFDCLALNPMYTPSAALIRSVEIAAPYGMVSPSSGNYRLIGSGTALPVDWCDASLGERANGDIEMGGLYDAPRANMYGQRDLGAFELAVGIADTIFVDGFDGG